MLLKMVREGLGRLIIFVDFITRPSKMKRTDDAQQAISKEVQGMSLYQFYACPFCVKTRRAIRRLNLPVVYRDAQKDQSHRAELLNEGGAIKVPCLRVEEKGETRWMYESSEIISYLEQRFGQFTAENA